MSYKHYLQSIAIATGEEQDDGEDVSFNSIIMGAMRKANTNDKRKLKGEWPEIWEELHARFMAPFGFLSKEEAKTLAHFTEASLEGVEFPKEGWPYTT